MKALGILLPVLFLFSCQSSEEFKTVNFENRYSISIPSFLKKTNKLNDDASFQYQNSFKEFYILVMDEPKALFQQILMENGIEDEYSVDLAGYSNLLIEVFRQSLSNSDISNIRETTINDMPARLITLNGRMDDIDAYCSFAFFEGEETYYQIMIWTLKSKEVQYSQKMEQIINSFKEL